MTICIYCGQETTDIYHGNNEYSCFECKDTEEQKNTACMHLDIEKFHCIDCGQNLTEDMLASYG